MSRIVRRTAATALAVITLAAGRGELARAQSPAAARVEEAITAMGGTAALERMGVIQVDAIGHQFALEQSERPEGPWLVTYQQRTETRDAALRRLLRQVQYRNWSAPTWAPANVTLVVTDAVAARTVGERWVPGRSQDIDDADEAFELSPERLLLTARAATDLRPAADRVLQGVVNHGVAFTWRNRQLALFLNAHTHLPTLLEVARDDTMFGIWGDVVERRWYSFWQLEAGGIWYPRQISTEWNGIPYADETVLNLTVNATVDEARFAIPDTIRAAFTKGLTQAMGFGTIRLDESKAVPLSDNVVLLPGSWNVTLVRQPDGIVVIEAPISSQYTSDVIAYAAKRFPGQKIKAVVSTSDAWPHIGGVREYVARGVPIHRLDLNAGILDRLVAARHTLSPDALSRTPRAAVWRNVTGGATIGTGDTRIELLPVRGEIGERMMFAWLPGLRLIYASDMVQRDRSGGFFWVGMLAEAEAVAARAGVKPERVMAMHLLPTPWSDVQAASARVRGR